MVLDFSLNYISDPRVDCGRNGTSDVPQRTSPATPRSARVSKTGGNESDTSGITPMKTVTERSPKVVERRSPRSPATEVILLMLK